MSGSRILPNATSALLAALALASCGGSGGGNGGTVDPPPPPTATTPTIAVSPVFTSLSFNQPTVLKQAPGDSSRWFVGEKGGFIRVFANNPDSSSASVFLDISGIVDAAGEGGLLGFTFHPDFPVTPEVFVSFTRGNPFRSYVSRTRAQMGAKRLFWQARRLFSNWRSRRQIIMAGTSHSGRTACCTSVSGTAVAPAIRSRTAKIR